jgi:hypothetical protein
VVEMGGEGCLARLACLTEAHYCQQEWGSQVRPLDF